MGKQNLIADCLAEASVDAKLSAVKQLAAVCRTGQLRFDTAQPGRAELEPGMPETLSLVAPRALQRRGLGTPRGHAAFIHAIAHIEFNAINLALDACHRFRDLPDEYYRDWIGVAAEEAGHFELLQAHLHDLGYRYGDFPAHSGLWDMARETAYALHARMAMVPRVLEARGLDVAPSMIERLRAIGDEKGADILQTIYRDEIGHVALGSKWYRYACRQLGRDPRSAFAELIKLHLKGRMPAPLNIEARTAAGFNRGELADLGQLFQES